MKKPAQEKVYRFEKPQKPPKVLGVGNVRKVKGTISKLPDGTVRYVTPKVE